MSNKSEGDMMRRVSVGLVVGLLLYASPAFTQGGGAAAKALYEPLDHNDGHRIGW